MDTTARPWVLNYTPAAFFSLYPDACQQAQNFCSKFNTMQDVWHYKRADILHMMWAVSRYPALTQALYDFAAHCMHRMNRQIESLNALASRELDQLALHQALELSEHPEKQGASEDEQIRLGPLKLIHAHNKVVASLRSRGVNYQATQQWMRQQLHQHVPDMFSSVALWDIMPLVGHTSDTAAVYTGNYCGTTVYVRVFHNSRVVRLFVNDEVFMFDHPVTAQAAVWNHLKPVGV